MKATRTKRMAGVIGLLMALILTATGCGVSQPPAPPVAASAAAQEKAKVADFNPALVNIDHEWEAVFGPGKDQPTAIAKDGLSILSVMYDQFPQFTVEGFVPTEADFNAVFSKLKPLSNEAGLKWIQNAWADKKDLPAIMSYRTELDAQGQHSYTYTTKSGEKCTDSDKPYSYKVESLSLTARPDETSNQVPVLTSHITLTVQCKEGGTLKGQMRTWFPLTQAGGKWIMRDGYQSDPASDFKMEK